MMKYDIVAVGELLIDFATIETDAQGYPAMKANPGGAPCNFLAAAGACGLKTAFIGKVGNDAFGRMLRGSLERAGVDTTGVAVDERYFTTLAFVTFDEHGDRAFSFARKPGADAMLSEEDIDRGIIDSSRVLHFGTLNMTGEPSKTATRKAVEFARNAGKLITFDPNLRMSLWDSEENAREQIIWGLEHCDIVKLSEEEMTFILGECSPQTAAAEIMERFGPKLVMVTLGADGCYISNGAADVSIPCPPADTIDTTGAGDIFCGTAIAGMLMLGYDPQRFSEEELLKVGRYAQAAASLSTEHSGGMSSIPTQEEVEAYIKRTGLASDPA